MTGPSTAAAAQQWLGAAAVAAVAYAAAAADDAVHQLAVDGSISSAVTADAAADRAVEANSCCHLLLANMQQRLQVSQMLTGTSMLGKT